MICNTRLSLSLLGSSGESTTPKRKSNQDQELDINPFPSLTLCLSSSAVNSSVISAAVSSFSNSSIKRERDASFEEEVELDTNKVIISPKLDDVDQEQDEDHEFGTRKKLRLTKEQSAVLEDSFKEHSTLNSKQKRNLATRLSLRPRQVEVWFQNRRARKCQIMVLTTHTTLRPMEISLSTRIQSAIPAVRGTRPHRSTAGGTRDTFERRLLKMLKKSTSSRQ
nr:homeobox-leucine zipper protein HAT22-like isoform X2 [Nicotiana tomentosiformis]